MWHMICPVLPGTQMKCLAVLVKANDKIKFLGLDKEYDEQDGWGGVAYFDDISDIEVEPLSSGDDEGVESSNGYEDSSDEVEEEAQAPSTNTKQCGHPVGAMILRRKSS